MGEFCAVLWPTQIRCRIGGRLSDVDDQARASRPFPLRVCAEGFPVVEVNPGTVEYRMHTVRAEGSAEPEHGRFVEIETEVVSRLVVVPAAIKIHKSRFA